MQHPLNHFCSCVYEPNWPKKDSLASVNISEHLSHSVVTNHKGTHKLQVYELVLLHKKLCRRLLTALF